MLRRDETLLRLEKRVDRAGRANGVLVPASATLACALLFLLVPLHPYLMALLAALVALAWAWGARRVVAMAPESIEVTRSQVVVVKDRERTYDLGPSTRVHLDVGRRGPRERMGPLTEVSFDSQREGLSRLRVANGWTGEQVELVYRVLVNLVEPREVATTVRFRRYMADLH